MNKKHFDKEQSLKFEHSRLMALFTELDPNPVFRFDTEGKITMANKAGLEIFGSNFLYEGKLSQIIPELKEFDLTSLIFEGKKFNIDTRINDRYLQFTICGIPELKIGQIYGTDITKRKLAEESLHESERRYRNIVENAPDVIYSLAEDGSIMSLNPAFERITGWSCSEWLGKPFMTLIHPSDLPLAVESFKQSLGGKKQPPYELRVLSKSGEYLVGEFTSVPLIEKGKVVGEFGISRNITERKQAEEIIKESEEKYHLLFENESDAIMILDIETSLFEDMNEASLNLFGYEREEFLKLSLSDISVEPEKSKFLLEATKESEIQKGLLSVFKKKNGETFIGEISMGTFISKGKQKTFGVARDISERIRREKELKNTLENNKQLLKEITRHKKTLQMLSSSLTTVHELERKMISQELHDEIGQTLATININLVSIEEKILPKMSQRIKERFKENKELLEIVLNQIQEISIRLRPLILDDLGLVPTLRWYISKYIERSNINVDFKVFEFSGRLNPEYELTIYRVVQEALTNVARHSQAKNVTIVMKMKNNCLKILIEDDGIGFKFNGVFDDLTTGRGIGIIHIQERIASLGGEVNFQTAPGIGTKIIIKLTL